MAVAGLEVAGWVPSSSGDGFPSANPPVVRPPGSVTALTVRRGEGRALVLSFLTWMMFSMGRSSGGGKNSPSFGVTTSGEASLESVMMEYRSPEDRSGGWHARGPCKPVGSGGVGGFPLPGAQDPKKKRTYTSQKKLQR